MKFRFPEFRFAELRFTKQRKAPLPGIWRILSKFWLQIRKRQLLIAGSFLALIAQTGFRLLEPWPLKFVFDRVLLPQASPESSGILIDSSLNSLAFLELLCFAVVAIAALKGTAAYLSTFGMALAATQIFAEIRAIIFSHLQRLSLSFHNQFKTGDLIIRVTSDVERLRGMTIKTALPFINNIITLVGMWGIMFWLNWQLSLILTTAFPLFLFFTNHLIGRIRFVTKKHRKSEGMLAATAAETIGAIKIIQTLSLEETFENNFFEQNEKSLHQGAQTHRLKAVLQRTVEILSALVTAIILWRGSDLVLQKSLTPGELLVFISYLKTAFQPMRQIAKQAAQITKALASGERILDLLESVPDVCDSPGAKKAPQLYGTVCFDNVTFGHESDIRKFDDDSSDIRKSYNRILKGISFEVQPGQKIGLVGPSGGGKSTLISLILRLFDPQEGRILIDWQDIRSYKLESLRRQVSVVLQDSVLFAVSIRDNIAYGTVGASEGEIQRAARLADAHDFIMKLPDGYDTVLAERGATLSGGQRQRIAIARAAIRKAPIVILDEPTTGLDSASEHAVSEALERLREGRTTFFISHKLKLVENADLIFYIEEGQILESGTHGELLSLRGKYANLYKLQNLSNLLISHK